jgi:hypothetical protein
MTKRTAITPGELYVLLDREFQRRKPASCDRCYVQLPFRVDKADEGAPNWEVVVPPRCEHGCSELIEELVADFQSRYELTPSAGPARS